MVHLVETSKYVPSMKQQDSNLLITYVLWSW